MTSLLLFLISIATFTFYGVIGEDKVWLLGPSFLLSYTAITAYLLRRAGRREPGKEERGPAAGLLFLLFLLWGLANIPHAAVPFEAKFTVLFVGAVIGAYLVWGSELTTFRDNRLLLGILIFVVMLLAMYGLIIHFRAPEKILWTERYADQYTSINRLASTYICPNHFAHLIQMLLPFCVALLFIPQSGMFLRLLCAYSFATYLPPLFLSQSRAGWLGAIAAVGLTLSLMALRRSRKLFLFIIVFLPLCAFLLLFAGWKYSETFQRRMKPVVEFLQGQVEDGVGSDSKDFRPQTWMDTIDMIKEKPWIGYGPGNYRYAFPEFRKRCQSARMVTGHPHNEYLELIADYGLIGFLLFALAWWYGLIRILIVSLKAEETRHAYVGFAFLGTAAGTMVHSFFDFQMHVFPNAIIFAILAAVAVGPLLHARRGSLKSLKPSNIEGVGDGGNSALEHGDSSPLPDSFGHEKHQNSCKESSSSSSDSSRAFLCSMSLKKFGAWLLAFGYLLLTIMCIQTMTSSYIRAMADKRTQALGFGRLASGDERSESQYVLSARIDPKNWRAYTGMAYLIYNQRYYSLDMGEKASLAEEEINWYKQAHKHNPKDPETILAYGKCLIFLGRVAGAEQGDGSAVDSGTGHPCQGNSNLKPNDQRQKPGDDIAQGLDMLRDACTYRPYNDLYWWNFGVELRKLGCYEESMEVFQKARSIRMSPSTVANIRWLKKQLQLQAQGTRHEAPGKAEGQTQTAESQESATIELNVPDPEDANADVDLMNLFEQMEK